MTRVGRYKRIYVYGGCSVHGSKIGVATGDAELPGRLVACWRRCPAHTEFAKVWTLENAYQIEQAVIETMGVSERMVPPGEEWFHASAVEMMAAVEFFVDFFGPRDRPRRYRTICGHFLDKDDDDSAVWEQIHRRHSQNSPVQP